MRILITTATYPPSVNGVAYHVQLLLNSLIQLGHKVMVLAPDNPEVDIPEAGIIRYPSFHSPIVENYPIGVPLVSFEKIKRFNPDVIHTHHPLIIGALSAYLANRLSIPLFFTNHTRYQEYIKYYLPIGTKITEKIFNNHIKGFGKKTKKIICPSSLIRDYLKDVNISNTVVIPNGIDLENFKSINTIRPKHLKLIFVGRLEKEKSPNKLLLLAHQIKKTNPQFHLTIVGSGKLSQSLQKQSHSLDLTKNVTFTGLIPRQKLSQLLNQHHFFISFSTSEVMPLTHLEAQACGLPAIIPKKSGLSDFLGPENSIIVSQNPYQAAETINQIFVNNNKYKQLAQNSTSNAQKYSSQNTAQQLIKLYQEK